MEIITIILLLLLGVILLIVEFMLIPGITIAGIGCVISFGASVFLAFNYWGTLAGIITLIAVIIFVPVFLYFLFKGRTMKSMMLNTNIDGIVDTLDTQKVKIGDEGITTGRLAPLGRAKINGINTEARSLGIFIDQKTEIRVIKIQGNTVIVEPINE
jgi:membrane-bound ClpP family serine protease